MYSYNFPGKEPDEKIIKIVRRHWTVILKPLFIILAYFALPIVLNIIFNLYIPRLLDFPYYPILVILGSVYVFIGWYLLLAFFVDYYFDVWIITNKRIIDIEQHSMFERVISTVKLYRVQDLTAETKGFFHSLFNFGDLHVQTAGEQKRFIFEEISHPNEVKAIIAGLQDQALAQQEKMEHDMLKQDLKTQIDKQADDEFKK